MRLGKKEISNGSNTYFIIAEAGVNHEGSMDIAKRLIELAKEGGADAIKFQTYKAGEIACRNSPSYWDTTKEKSTSQFELFQRYDKFGEREFQELKRHSDRVGIQFLSTAFDLDAFAYIDKMVDFHKIASADLTNVPFLRAVAKACKPVIISTGAASFEEVQGAIDELKKHGAVDISLLHCVLNYPTPDNLAYLGRIYSLKARFGSQAVIGYSDHTLPTDGCYPVVAAYFNGARVIEKHFTHDKTLPGNDHYHAMDVKDCAALVAGLERAKILLGAPEESVFLNSQKAAITNARRSIVSKQRITRGTVLTEAMLTTKRPGTGISPVEWDKVLGYKAAIDIEEDMPLQWSQITQK